MRRNRRHLARNLDSNTGRSSTVRIAGKDIAPQSSDQGSNIMFTDNVAVIPRQPDRGGGYVPGQRPERVTKVLSDLNDIVP